jgi:uncharacterized membrane protein
MHSKTENKEIMAKARDSLSGRWGFIIGVFAIYMIILIVVQLVPIAGPFLGILIGGSMAIGAAIISLAVSRKQECELSQLFAGFNRFGTGLAAHFLQGLFIILWSFLLIVPGIMAAISYAMTYFIIVEDDSIGALDAIAKSKKMMHGNKWKFFCLGLRFFGWSLLACLTLGIGFLWVTPYYAISAAQFYDEIKPELATQN